MAVRAWGRIRPSPAVSVPLLANVLRDADPSVRTEAMKILTDVGKPAVPTLTRLLSDDKVAYWCCLALGEIGPDAAAAAPALVNVLDSDPRPEVRREAALALGWIGTAAAASVPALTDALGKKDPVVVAGAAYALGRIGAMAKTAAPSLVQCEANSDPLVKMVCAGRWRKSIPRINRESRRRLDSLWRHWRAISRGFATRLYTAWPTSSPRPGRCCRR